MDRALLQLNIALENPHMNHYPEVSTFLGEIFAPVLRSLEMSSFDNRTFYWHLCLACPNEWFQETVHYTALSLNHTLNFMLTRCGFEVMGLKIARVKILPLNIWETQLQFNIIRRVRPFRTNLG